MHRWMENDLTTFEKPLMSGLTMDHQVFPCVHVVFNEGQRSTPVEAFLNHRSSERWVLLGQHAVQSSEQLWTAWIQAARNELRQSMVARSIDAEFLRYLAGTHHISEAFARAGWRTGQTGAWVVYLCEAEGQANDLGHLQPKPLPYDAFIEHFNALCSTLNWSTEQKPMVHSIEGMLSMGIDVEGWPDERLHEAIIAHILMADDQSSSHR